MNKNIKIALLGLGLSNYGLANFLFKNRFKNVFISEINKNNEYIKYIKNMSYPMEVGKNTPSKLLDANIIIVSPGIPKYNPIIKEAYNKNIEVMCDVEFIYRLFPNKKYIAITGTNGKSTTTSLIYQILKYSNIPASMGGNIGIPVGKIFIDEKKSEIFVLELSSYQLEYCSFFKPKISVFLNISENHIHHHRNMENYLRAKLNIIRNSSNDSITIFSSSLLNLEDNNLNNLIKNSLNKFKGKKIFFGFNEKYECFYKNEKIIYRKSEILNTNGLKLLGKHNIENVMASILTGINMELNIFDIQKAIKEYKGLSHRLEIIIQNNNITVINDSKSTTIVSLIKALESFNKKVILIAGGYDKGISLEPLKGIIKKHVKYAVLFGDAKERFFNFFSKLVDSYKEQNLKNAIYKAFSLAKKKDIILFSPACASFDEFKNFEERGEFFKKIALKLNSC